MRTMTGAEVDTFLRHATRTAKLATVRPDGHPHVVPVWFVVDGADLVITTASGSAKARHLSADPRVSVCVDDETAPFAFVTVFGTATLRPRPADLLAWTTRIAARYVGPEAAVEVGRRYAEFDDLLVRIRMVRVVGQAEVSA
jgi:PPOX class probable F420-dependent enzyme